MLVHIENLVKRYGDLLALDHLSLDIEEGEIFGLLGPNGSGTVSYTHLDVYKRQIMRTRSCGEVTITMPSTGRDWNTVSGTSPVPGGMSTKR